MIRKNALLVVCCLFASCLAAHADSAPFGVLSAYNLVALGTTGSNAIAGSISTGSELEGRAAAANELLSVGGIGQNLRNDPWGSLANGYALVAGGGISDAQSFSIGCAGCNVWAPSSSAKINFNGGGQLYTTGSDPINFNVERLAMQSESGYLATLTANGTVRGNTLTGTSKTLNIFNVTTTQLNSMNNMNIVTPPGSTVIINVLNDGSSSTFKISTAMSINGAQASDSNYDNGDILFNFSEATNLDIDAQFDASILAPYSILNGGSQMGGNFIVAQVDTTGEVHNHEFEGSLPTPPKNETPEPASLALMGTGILLMAGLQWRRKRV